MAHDAERVVTRYIGGRIEEGDETLSVLLGERVGREGLVFFTPDAARALAYDLLSLVGQIEHRQQLGVEPDATVGERVRAEAILVEALRVDTIENTAGAVVAAQLQFWDAKMARFPLFLPRGLLDQLCIRLNAIR